MNKQIEQNNNEFISISDAVTQYKVSQNKIRKIVKDNARTNFIKTVPITGKSGFKYLISTSFLDSVFGIGKAETSQKQGINEPKTDFKQDNQLIIQLQSENKQLSNQINRQNETIDKLTDTISEQNKVIISQSMQIYQLTTATEPPPNERATAPNQIHFENSKVGPDNTKKMLTIELLIISILVVCIVVIIAFLVS